MINFRFHLVSLIAVFLALALGVVVGSTVIDRAIVDGLEAQIERVERNVEAQRRENAELRQRIDRMGVYVDQSAPFTVEGRLTEIPIVVMAVRGVDENAVRATVETLRGSGGTVSGVLWLQESWALVEPDHLQAMQGLFARPSRASDTLRRRALTLLVQRLSLSAETVEVPEDAAPGAGEPEPGDDDEEALSEQESPADDTTTVPPDLPDGEDPDVGPSLEEGDALFALLEAGFLELDPAGGDELDPTAYPEVGHRVLVIDGPDARVSADALFVPLVRALGEGAVPTVTAEVAGGDADTEAGAVVGLIRDDADLRELVTTVDGAEGVRGRVAVVLALEATGSGRVGHYGTGPGASRQLPERVEP